MRKIIFALFFLLSFAACRPVYHVTSTTATTSDTTTTKIAIPREIETVFYTKPDSATLTALIKCDSLNNAFVEEINSQPGKQTKIRYIIKFDTLKIFADVDSLAIHLKFKAADTLTTVKINNKTTETKTITPEQKKNLPDWVFLAGFLVALLLGAKLFSK